MSKPLNWTEKWGACREAGIKYIHSVEIYLTESLEEKVRDNYHTVLMARNMDGLRELNDLVRLSCQKDHFYYTNRITFEEFLNLSDNIITTSACLASPLNKLDRSHPLYMDLARKYDFLEIQPHNCKDQIDFNKKLLNLSREIGTPLIAGTDTHSSNQYKAECRAVLLDAKHKSYGDEDSFDLTYKRYDELVEAFKIQSALPEQEFMEAIENTNMLYDMTDEIELDTSIKYPILYGSREKDSQVFQETVEIKFQEKLDTGVIPREQEEAFKEAIPEEMRVFKKLQMDGFMLSMSELISWCKEQGMAIGTARGSVGGSRVAYVTDIIDLNPETWHTVFSRFCNEDREEIGDIDIDCVESDRPLIFKHIIERFGKDKTARVASFGTMQSKGVIDDVGRHLAQEWASKHENSVCENPWSLSNIARIKKEFDDDEEKTKANYPELFYYFDGLSGTKISQSIHPAGMVISPITLHDNFGVFDKEGEICLLLDMENIHDYTGLAKYDFLILKTVQVIRDTCNYLGTSYPKTHEINWDDLDVWDSMRTSAVGLFQFEGQFAHNSLRRFRPKNIFDITMVTACIRPSGTSYRDDLLAKIPHKNPSALIDNLLAGNLGYLIYQEDTIKFLQQICGLSGSEADNVRRAIGRKQKDRLDAAMPSILDGYCGKSDQPREIAEKEAKEFLQIIEDSANYQFGYNHAIAYSLLTYLCAYYRFYHPLEFMTAYLNNAANDDDIHNGTVYCESVGIEVTMPKWGISKSIYSYDTDKNVIAKGLASVKYMNNKVVDELYVIANGDEDDEIARYLKWNLSYTFVDILYAIDQQSSLNTRQLEVLIKIDFFSKFGNQRELLNIKDLFYNQFRRGNAKKISKNALNGTEIEEIVKKYAVGKTKSGEPAKMYTLLDVYSILKEAEELIYSKHLPDLDDATKMRNFAEYLGYAGYVSGKEEDRRKLYLVDVFPLKRKKDGKQFAHCLVTKSIGSGKESRFMVKDFIYNKIPVKPGDVIQCVSYTGSAGQWQMTEYKKIG